MYGHPSAETIDRLDAAELEAVKRRIGEKYDKRLAQYAAGEKQWETVVSLTMILRGVKPQGSC